MKILQRYILHEIWLPFLLCLVTLNFIFMGGYLVRAANFIIGRGIPLGDTLYVLLLALPDMVSYTVPMSVLTAVLIVFGNLSQNNEIRAVKASGVHPLQVMLPALLIGLGLSFVMFIFNDQITSNAAFQLRRVSRQMMIKHPKAMIEPKRFVHFNENVVFLTKELNGNLMRDVLVYETESAEKPPRTILAERGEIVADESHSTMKIRLYDGTISDAQDKGVQAIRFETYEFSIMDQSDVRKMQKKIRDLTLAELLLRLTDSGISKADRTEIWSAFHNRISFSLGSFIFVFIGIPIAMLVRRGEIILSFGISMAMACLYYILFVGAKTISLSEVVPPVVAFWMPNLLLLAVGAHLLKRSLVS